MKRHEKLCGVNLFIDESYTARVEGLNVFIHPQYEFSAKAVLRTMIGDYPSFGSFKEEPMDRNILKHLKVFIPNIQS